MRWRVRVRLRGRGRAERAQLTGTNVGTYRLGEEVRAIEQIKRPEVR